MADYRADKSGFAKEAQDKISAKYSEELASQVLAWIGESSGQQLDTNGNMDNFVEQLKDGKVLCNFANALSPGSIKKINESKLQFKQMENIGFFLDFLTNKCEMPKHELFQTTDLYEAQAPNSVVVCLAALARKTERLFGVKGFGPKELEKAAPRQWSEEQLRAGDAIIGLQMGSNKGASQSGMTAPGTYRHM